MNWQHSLGLLGAGVLAGAINAVAGGGSIVAFPALVLLGVDPLRANATTALSLWPGSLAALMASARDLPRATSAERRWVLLLSLASLVGSLLGARLLVDGSPRFFERLVPYIVALATLLFAAGPRVVRWMSSRRTQDSHIPPLSTTSMSPSWGVVAAQAIISVYGGYFGAGMGLLMLAAYQLAGDLPLVRLNAIKVLQGVVINGVALVVFLRADAIEWTVVPWLAGGAALGGFWGARWGARVSQPTLRRWVVAAGVLLSLRLWLRS